MRFSQWCQLWRLTARHIPIAYTDCVNPALNEAQQAQANQVMVLLLRSYLEDFLTESRVQNRAFAQPCYFFNRALRVPVWMALHRLIFDEPWAGCFRSYDLSRGLVSAEFCPARELPKAAHHIMYRLRVEVKAVGMNPQRVNLTDFLAQMHTYLNYVHPFADGNGRLQRMYLNLVAGYYGWLIDWSLVNRDAYLEAVRLAFRLDRTPLQLLLDGAMVSLNDAEE